MIDFGIWGGKQEAVCVTNKEWENGEWIGFSLDYSRNLYLLQNQRTDQYGYRVDDRKIMDLYKEGLEWNELKQGHTYQIFFDKHSGDVWIKTYLDENSYTAYVSDDIVSLPVSDAEWNTDAKPEEVAKYLADIAGEMML